MTSRMGLLVKSVVLRCPSRSQIPNRDRLRKRVKTRRPLELKAASHRESGACITASSSPIETSQSRAVRSTVRAVDDRGEHAYSVALVSAHGTILS